MAKPIAASAAATVNIKSVNIKSINDESLFDKDSIKLLYSLPKN